MDGCVAHTSMVIHTSSEKADVDSHTHMSDTYIHSGQREILLRVLSQNQNRKPLKRLSDSVCRGPESRSHTRRLGHTHVLVQN